MLAPAKARRERPGGSSNEVSFHELLDAVAAGDFAPLHLDGRGQAAVILGRELDVVDRQRRAAYLPDAEVAERLRGVEGERLLVGGRRRIGKREDQRSRGVMLDFAGGVVIGAMDVAVEHG